MSDLSVLLLGIAALAVGGLIASTRGGNGIERTAHLGAYPLGNIPPSEQLARRLVATGQFQERDLEPLIRAIEARRSILQTPGRHKLYPYRVGDRMIDIGYVIRNGVRSPLSYVSYPVGGTPAQGTWRPI